MRYCAYRTVLTEIQWNYDDYVAARFNFLVNCAAHSLTKCASLLERSNDDKHFVQ